MYVKNTFLSFIFVLFMASTLLAQYTATESFEYSTGSSLDASVGTSGNGWGGSWYLQDGTESLSSVTSEGVMYDDLDYEVPYVGNQLTVSLPGNWTASRYFRPLAQPWPREAGKEYWISYLFQASTVPSDLTYYLFKLFHYVEGSDTTEMVAMGKSGGGTTYSCGSGWAGGAGPDVSDVQCLGDPVWLVTKIVISESDSAETYMWINPDPSAEPEESSANVSRMTYIHPNGINTVAIENGGADSLDLYYDEIRLGTSYEEVTSSISSDYYVQESFDYPAGSLLDAIGSAGNGWSTGWFLFDDGANESVMTVEDTAIVYDDLDYEIPNAGMQVSGANPVAWGFQRYGRYLDKNWPDEAGTTYWISFLCELDYGFTDNGWAGLGLFKDDTTEYRLLGHEWGNGYYGLATYGGETGYTSYRWDAGPVWIVTKIVMTGDTTAERAFMWINIDPDDVEPDTSSAEAKASFGLNDGFDMIVVHFGGEGVGMTMAIDEIRLGTSWENVSGELITDVETPIGSVVPTDFALAQNYPNPFNPSTTITFSIPEEGIVTLRVFDIIGREVASLVQNERVAAGSYNVSFDASSLASGTYFYQLQTDKSVQTKKNGSHKVAFSPHHINYPAVEYAAGLLLINPVAL